MSHHLTAVAPTTDHPASDTLAFSRPELAIICLHPDRPQVLMLSKPAPHLPGDSAKHWQFLQGPYLADDSEELIGQAARRIIRERLMLADPAKFTPGNLQLLDVGHQPTTSQLPAPDAARKGIAKKIHHWALVQCIGNLVGLQAVSPQETLSWVDCWEALNCCQPFRKDVYATAMAQFRDYLPEPPADLSAWQP